MKRKRKLFALIFLSYRCIITINVLWLFLTVPWAGLSCVIVVFPDHTHFLYLIADERFVVGNNAFGMYFIFKQCIKMLRTMAKSTCYYLSW